jgi:hypothetical protein
MFDLIYKNNKKLRVQIKATFEELMFVIDSCDEKHLFSHLSSCTKFLRMLMKQLQSSKTSKISKITVWSY